MVWVARLGMAVGFSVCDTYGRHDNLIGVADVRGIIRVCSAANTTNAQLKNFHSFNIPQFQLRRIST